MVCVKAQRGDPRLSEVIQFLQGKKLEKPAYAQIPIEVRCAMPAIWEP